MASQSISASSSALARRAVNEQGKAIIKEFLDEKFQPNMRIPLADRKACVDKVKKAGNDWFRMRNLKYYVTKRQEEIDSVCHCSEEEILFSSIPRDLRDGIRQLCATNAAEPKELLFHVAKQYPGQIDDIQEYYDWLQDETDNEDGSTSDSFSDIPGDIKEKLQHLLRMNPTASERIRKIWASRVKVKQELALWYLRHLEEDGVGGSERSRNRKQLAHTSAVTLYPPPQGPAFSVPGHQVPSTTHSACSERDAQDNLCCPTQPMHALGPQVRIDGPSEDKHAAGTTRLLSNTADTILPTLMPQPQARLHSLSLAQDGRGHTRPPAAFTHIPRVQRRSSISSKDECSARVAELNVPTIGLSDPITAFPIQPQTHSVSRVREGHNIARRSTMIVQTPEVRQQRNATSSKDKHTVGATGVHLPALTQALPIPVPHAQPQRHLLHSVRGGPVGLRPSLVLWQGGHSPSEGRHNPSSIGLHPHAPDPNSMHCLQGPSHTHSVSPVRDSVGSARLHLPAPESAWPTPVNGIQSRLSLLPLMRDGRDIANRPTALIHMPEVQRRTNIMSNNEYSTGAAGAHPLAPDSKYKYYSPVPPQTQSVSPVRDGNNDARRPTTLVCTPEIQQQRSITSKNERSIGAARLHLPTPGSALPISALQVQSQTNSILPMRDGHDDITSKDVRSVPTAGLHVPTPGTVLPIPVPRAQSQAHSISPMRNGASKPVITVTEIQERVVSPGIPCAPSSFKIPCPGTPCNSGDSPTSEQDLLYPSEELPESTENANDLHTNVQDARVPGREAGDEGGHVKSCIPRKRVYEEVTNNDRVGTVGGRTLSQHKTSTSSGTAQEDSACVARQEGLDRDEIGKPENAVTSSSEAEARASTSHAVLNKANEPTVVDGQESCSGTAQEATNAFKEMDVDGEPTPEYTTSDLQQSREGPSRDSDPQDMEMHVANSMDADLESPPKNMRELSAFMEKYEGPLDNLLLIREQVLHSRQE